MASDDDNQNSGFLSRWSRRKALVRGGEPVAPEPLRQPIGPAPAVVPTPPPTASQVATSQAAATQLPPTDASLSTSTPPPNLADVEALTRESDYSPFVARGVTADVRNAALKKLFTDPHFNVMDGLDTYIGDYNTPDPLPPGMLRKMVQSQLLGLFDDEKPALPPDTPPPAPESTPAANENPAVQLQPVDDARRSAAEPGAGPDPTLQH
ncbi:MAG TPA: DUF3306 domain-containing protein [Rubrivivax sp.]|nr:DUF3306 domain-containing protein [Rubrivivax sp.]